MFQLLTYPALTELRKQKYAQIGTLMTEIAEIEKLMQLKDKFAMGQFDVLNHCSTAQLFYFRLDDMAIQKKVEHDNTIDLLGVALLQSVEKLVKPTARHIVDELKASGWEFVLGLGMRKHFDEATVKVKEERLIRDLFKLCYFNLIEKDTKNTYKLIAKEFANGAAK